jgi:hypothetical protein
MWSSSRAGARIAAMVAATVFLSGSACHRIERSAAAGARPPATEQEMLLADLHALPIRTDAKDPAVARLRRRFETLYRAQPDAARAAPDIVRDERELRGKLILDALEHAETLESADALGTVATDDRAAGGARQYALECLRGTSHVPLAPGAQLGRSVARR